MGAWGIAMKTYVEILYTQINFRWITEFLIKECQHKQEAMEELFFSLKVGMAFLRMNENSPKTNKFDYE